MCGEGSTPGGARASISLICEAYCIEIGHNAVFLNIFTKRSDLHCPKLTGLESRSIGTTKETDENLAIFRYI